MFMLKVPNSVYRLMKAIKINKMEWLKSIGRTVNVETLVAAIVAWREELGKDFVAGLMATGRAPEIISALEVIHLEDGEITGNDWQERQREPMTKDEKLFAEFESKVFDICHQLQAPQVRNTGLMSPVELQTEHERVKAILAQPAVA